MVGGRGDFSYPLGKGDGGRGGGGIGRSQGREGFLTSLGQVSRGKSMWFLRRSHFTYLNTN